MYKCGLCGTLSKPTEPANRVVTQTRPKVYDVPQSSKSKRRTPRSFTEIVKEVLACLSCATKHALGDSASNRLS